jgi:stress-induced morphogen
MKRTAWTIQAVCLLGLVILSGCTSTIPAPTVSTRLATIQDQATIEALQKRLQGRERTIAMQHYQIEVLSSQLDALKRIDQDTTVQQRPVRNLMNVAP